MVFPVRGLGTEKKWPCCGKGRPKNVKRAPKEVKQLEKSSEKITTKNAKIIFINSANLS